jgi:hypothetical protein
MGVRYPGRLLASAIVLASALIFAAPAAAAPPANDDFASAQAVTLPSTTAGTLAESTIQTDEPNPSGSIFVVPTQSVWYSWTSPGTTSKVKFSACPAPVTGSTPGVAIYTGTDLNSLTLVTTSGANTLDNESDCSVKLVAPPTTAYKIVVYNKHTSFNNVTLGAFQLQLRALNPPANDDFMSSSPIPSALPQVVGGTNVDATGEPGEPNHFLPTSSGARASVWYSWTAPASMPVRLNACQNNGPEPTVVAVYTGSDVASLTPVAWFQSCRAYLDAVSGTTYRIAADQLAGNAPEGPFSLLIRQANPPPNDDLEDAQVIPGATIDNVSGTTVDATTEMGEPNHIISGGPPGPPDFGPPASVWFAWTSGPSGGSVTIDGCDPAGGSIAVYTGDSYANLSPVIPINGGCSQTFTAAPSTNYKIAVEGLGDGAAFILNPPPAPPSGGGGGGSPPASPSPPGPTGRRAAALKKCKKKPARARKACIKRAKRLPA